MDQQQFENALKELAADATVPTWAKVLINCISHFMKEKGNGVARVTKIEEEFKQLQDANRLLAIQIAGLKDELDALEQYSRRNCLIFHGIPEEKGESTSKAVLDVINNALQISEEKVSIKDIDRSHRLGKMRSPARETRANRRPNRPIIVKFKGYDSRAEVFSNKKKLKGKNIMITENLTAKRFELLKKCIDTLGKGNVWTFDGRITTKIDDEFIVINSEEDLASL